MRRFLKYIINSTFTAQITKQIPDIAAFQSVKVEYVIKRLYACRHGTL